MIPRVAIWLSLLPALGHTFEFSSADVNWNPAASAVEIVISLHSDDLESFLRTQHHRHLELDRDADAESLVCRYLLTVFELRGAPLRCIGIKPGVHFTDAFLEARPKNRKPPRYLRNQILVEAHPRQKNRVNLKVENKPSGRSVEYAGKDSWRLLPW